MTRDSKYFELGQHPHKYLTQNTCSSDIASCHSADYFTQETGNTFGCDLGSLPLLEENGAIVTAEQQQEDIVFLPHCQGQNQLCNALQHQCAFLSKLHYLLFLC